ncbi:MAG: DUF2332 domain-containing protein [Myxococcota bacterium]
MAPAFDTHSRDPEQVAELFRYFAEVETPRLQSRVYTDYCAGIAEDPKLLELACRTIPSQPPPNVFFAAVKDLLLEDAERSDEARALARFYPAVSGGAIPDESAFPAFRAFCLAHEDELDPALRSGRTQTCVVHRAAIMLPAIGTLPRVVAANGRVGLLEIGPSLGLNLRLDHYRFVYEVAESARTWGADDVRPELVCSVRGGTLPLPSRLEIVARQGLELSPIDVHDQRAVRWLRALIWPEHVERGRLMDEAIAVAERVPADIVAGDATTDVEAAVARLPADAPRVVFATVALYQIDEAGQRAIHEALARASASQPLDFVTMESNGQGVTQVDHFAFEAGERVASRVLAEADSHGRWIDWRVDR